MERFFAAESVAVIGASRRQDTIGRTLVRNLVLGGYAGRVYVVNPAADAVRGHAGVQTVQDVPDPVDLAVVAVPADAVHEVVLDCAAKGVHGLVVVSSGFAETGHEGRQRQRQLVGAGPGVRAAGGRPELPRGDQHRLRRLAQRLAVAGDAAARPGRLLLPVRRARGGDPGDGRAPRPRPLDVRRRPATGPTSPATTSCSTGRRTTRPRSCCSTWSRSATRASSPGSPAGSARHKPVVAVKSGRSTQGVPVGHAVRTTVAPQAAVDAMFRQAGVIQVDTLDEMFDVAQLLAHQPLADGPAGRRRRQLRRARAAGRGRRPRRPACRSSSRSRWAPRPPPRTSSAALDDGDRRPRASTPSSPSSSRRCNTPGEQVAQRPGGRRRAVATSRWCRRSSAARACRSCCGCPTSKGRPVAGRCRRTRRRRTPCGRWPGSSRTPSGRTGRRARCRCSTTSTRPRPGRS